VLLQAGKALKSGCDQTIVRSAVAITHPIRPDLPSQVLPIRGSCPTSIILWTTGTAGFEFPYLVTGGRDGVEGLDQRGALDV